MKMELHNVTSTCWVVQSGREPFPFLTLVVVLQGAVTDAFHQSEL